MPLTVCQWQIGAIVIGTATLHLVGVDGLGRPEPKTQDVNLDQADGVVFGHDFQSQRVIALTVAAVDKSGASGAMGYAKALVAEWSVGGDRTLLGNMPGWGAMSFAGRCRGVDVDVSHMRAGLVHMQCTFVSANSAIA